MNNYSAIKGENILTHATTWMNLDNILLSERARPKRPKGIKKGLQ
jgi:hypothetical protein